jgi:hypothetical protein
MSSPGIDNFHVKDRKEIKEEGITGAQKRVKKCED